MPYKKKTAKRAKAAISENVRQFLLTGERVKADAETFRLSGSRDRLEQVWDAVKTELMRDWVKTHPCTRPFIFWLLAPEKRKKVSGSGGWRPGMAVDAEGLPKYWQLWWNKKQAPNFESQAAYLDRHGLLSDAERTYLAKHKELLKPVKVEFNDEDED